jgi:hypothetical protein
LTGETSHLTAAATAADSAATSATTSNEHGVDARHANRGRPCARLHRHEPDDDVA